MAMYRELGREPPIPVPGTGYWKRVRVMLLISSSRGVLGEEVLSSEYRIVSEEPVVAKSGRKAIISRIRRGEHSPKYQALFFACTRRKVYLDCSHAPIVKYIGHAPEIVV